MKASAKPTTLSFRVYVTPEEKAQILQAASDCRLSISAYCRMLVLGGAPPDRVALGRIDQLAKAMADLNRLGGLMKMLLTNTDRLQETGRDMAVATIGGILVDIRFIVVKLEELIDAITGMVISEENAALEGAI